MIDRRKLVSEVVQALKEKEIKKYNIRLKKEVKTNEVKYNN